MEKAISPKPYKALLPPFLFVSSLWIVHLAFFITHTSGVSFGIYPRNAFGISGIFTSVFIHDDWNHLFNNSIPLLILGWALFHFYKEVAYPVVAYIWLVSGFWLWLIGRESFHIGASGIVYGLAAYLILSGIIRKEIRVAGVSLLVVFLYGSMIWGLLPIDYHVSFEAHICGALAGLFMAWFYRKSGIQAPVFKWEDEEELKDDANAYWNAPLFNPDLSEIKPEMEQKKGESEKSDSPLL